MTYEEIKHMNNKELHGTLREERKQLQKLKFNHAVSPIENPTKIRASRKFIARMMTEMTARRNATVEEKSTEK